MTKTYQIEKKTPATRWFVAHGGIDDLELAKYMLAEIAQNYDNDSKRSDDSSISEDGMSLQAFKGGDEHEYRIVEVSNA